MVFWWTGRGYLALLSLVGVFGAFGALVTFGFGDRALETSPWLWGIGAFLAAAVNWIWGSRINRRPWRVTTLAKLKDRLAYRARNRFCGLPMETWTVPTALFGVVAIARGLLAPGVLK